MEDVLIKEICSICKKHNTNDCKKEISRYTNKYENNLTSIQCLNYSKDSKKIVKPPKPILVTAKRDYVSEIQR